MNKNAMMNTSVGMFCILLIGLTTLLIGCYNTVETPSVDAFICGIPKFDVVKNEDIITGIIEENYVEDGVPGKLIKTKKKMERAFDSLVALSPNVASLFPGNVVRGDKIATGELTSIPVPLSESTLTLSGLQFIMKGAKYSITASTTLQGTRDALTTLLDQGKTSTVAAISYNDYRCYSVEQMTVSIGAGYSSIGFSGALNTKFNDNLSSNVFVVKLIQPYYTLSVAPKMRPSLYFKAGTSVSELSSAIGRNNPPIYISSVTYGRMLIFILRSNKSAKELEAAIRASFGSICTSGNLNIDVNTRNVLNTTDISLMVLGGSAKLTVEAIAAKSGVDKTDVLKSLLLAGREYSPESPATPISYQLKYLSDDEAAKISLIAPYTEESWRPCKLSALKVDGYTFGDDKKPESIIHLSIIKNGVLMANGCIGNIRLYPHANWNISLNMQMKLTARDFKDSCCRITLSGDHDDWKMNYKVIGVLENNQQVELGGHDQEYELNPAHPLSDTLRSPF